MELQRRQDAATTVQSQVCSVYKLQLYKLRSTTVYNVILYYAAHATTEVKQCRDDVRVLEYHGFGETLRIGASVTGTKKRTILVLFNPHLTFDHEDYGCT